MSSTGSSKLQGLIAVVLGLVLGLSMIAAGLRIGAGIAIEGAALRDCIGGDQVHNLDAPGQPPPRLLDAELRKDSDAADERSSADAIVDALPQARAAVVPGLAWVERRSNAAQRVRECHGARGPPRA